MFVIKPTLSPEIPLTTVWCDRPAGWLEGHADWRLIPIISKVQQRLKKMLCYSIEIWYIYETEFYNHNSTDQWSHLYIKKTNFALILNFEHIRLFSSLISLRRSNYLITWRPHFLLLAIILDISENAYNILKISPYVLSRTYLHF
jgi:hypothetical protein